MAKRIFITLLALSVAAAAFASGQKDQSDYGPFQGDKLVVKGTVSLTFPHPILKSGDKQYLLMVPPRLVARSGVKDGAQVAVQGYQVRGMPFYGNADNKYVALWVTQATIDGKDYDLSRYYDGWGRGGRGYGRGWGMMGGYGPGGGRGWGMMGGGYGPGPGCPGWDGDDD